MHELGDVAGIDQHVGGSGDIESGEVESAGRVGSKGDQRDSSRLVRTVLDLPV